MAMNSGNPALRGTVFTGTRDTTQPMTLRGTVNRTAMLLTIVLIGAGWVWNLYFSTGSASSIMPYLIGGTVGGLVLAVVTIYKKQLAAVTSPVYALLEGFAIGAVSALYEARHPGIAVQAVALTMGTMACMLVAYRFGLIRATEKFKLGIVAATGGVALLYLIDLALMFFGHPMSMIHEGGVIGIGFSLVVVAIAALNLIIDFDMVEQGVAARSAKYMEWYCAFALVVTLVWLYLEILRLLSKRR